MPTNTTAAATPPRLRSWAAVYVGAWLVGLVAAPAAPADPATAEQVHAHFAEHAGAAVAQSILVHGIAGVALAGITIGLARQFARTQPRHLHRALLISGIAAAAASLLQVSSLIALVGQLGDGRSHRTLGLFDAVNTIDSAKLLALGLLVGTATLAASRAPGSLPRWLRILAAVLAPLLPISGAAFLVSSPVLTTLLYVSLPLLLVWVFAIATAVSPPRPARRRPARRRPARRRRVRVAST